MMKSCPLLLILLLCHSTGTGNAFVVPTRKSAKNCYVVPTVVAAASSSRSHLDDLDNARLAFEQLMKEQHPTLLTAIPTTKEEYMPRPLTNSGERRRKAEMNLLKSLEDSDEAIDELMSLWLTERDAESANKLLRMEEECSLGLLKEEQALRDMIESFGIDWVEPVSRLAATLYFKGETEESEYWCHVALAVKPWHFEVTQTLVLNALRRQDFASALQWRRQSLPSLNESTGNRKRTLWVQKALKEAKESYRKAEEEAQRLHQRQDDDSLFCEDPSSAECAIWQ